MVQKFLFIIFNITLYDIEQHIYILESDFQVSQIHLLKH